MSNSCKDCGSYAINHHKHGRDGSDPDLCDVCYWYTRATKEQQAIQALRERLQQIHAILINEANELLNETGGVVGYDAMLDEGTFKELVNLSDIHN